MVGLVLERVTQEVNEAICRNNRDDLLIYSIFSGRATFGGQSLNVWDSVFVPPFKASFFPPTAKYTVDQFLDVYNCATIAEHMAELMAMTGRGEFPKSPASLTDAQVAGQIAAINPWLPIDQGLLAVD